MPFTPLHILNNSNGILLIDNTSNIIIEAGDTLPSDMSSGNFHVTKEFEILDVTGMTSDGSGNKVLHVVREQLGTTEVISDPGTRVSMMLNIKHITDINNIITNILDGSESLTEINVSGNSYLTGTVDISGILTVVSAINAQDGIISTTGNFSSNVIIGGYIDLTGDLTCGGTFTGNSISLSNDLEISGNSTLFGSVDISGTLTGTDIISSTANFSSNLTVGGNADITGTLSSGAITSSGSISCTSGSFIGNITIGDASGDKQYIINSGSSNNAFFKCQNNSINMALFGYSGSTGTIRIGRYDVSGAYQDDPISISQATGNVTFSAAISATAAAFGGALSGITTLDLNNTLTLTGSDGNFILGSGGNQITATRAGVNYLRATHVDGQWTFTTGGDSAALNLTAGRNAVFYGTITGATSITSTGTITGSNFDTTGNISSSKTSFVLSSGAQMSLSPTAPGGSSAQIFLSPTVSDGTSNATIEFMRYTNTTGTYRRSIWYRGDNSTTNAMSLNHQTGALIVNGTVTIATSLDVTTTSNLRGNVQIGGTLDVTGNLYAVGDVSALTFTDRSPVYLGNALEKLEQIGYIENSEDENNEWAEVDHNTLPTGIKREETILQFRDKNTSKQISQREIQKIIKRNLKSKDNNRGESIFEDNASKQEFRTEMEWLENKYTIESVVEQRRDIGASIQLNLQAIKQLHAKIKDLENQIDELSKSKK